MCVHVCTHVCACIYTFTHTYIRIYIYKENARTDTQMCICIFCCFSMCMCVCMHIFVRRERARWQTGKGRHPAGQTCCTPQNERQGADCPKPAHSAHVRNQFEGACVRVCVCACVRVCKRARVCVRDLFLENEVEIGSVGHFAVRRLVKHSVIHTCAPTSTDLRIKWRRDDCQAPQSLYQMSVRWVA